MEAFSLDSYQDAPGAAQPDVTPPTFAGIATLVPNANGSLEATWLAATGLPLPLAYTVFIALGVVTAAELFVDANRHSVIEGLPLSARLFTLANRATYLANGQVYTVGVRAKDSVGNEETNVAILTATSVGVVPDAFSASLALLNAAIAAGSCDIEAVIDDDTDDSVEAVLDEC